MEMSPETTGQTDQSDIISQVIPATVGSGCVTRAWLQSVNNGDIFITGGKVCVLSFPDGQGDGTF